jgi:hypothetical protein
MTIRRFPAYGYNACATENNGILGTNGSFLRVKYNKENNTVTKINSSNWTETGNARFQEVYDFHNTGVGDEKHRKKLLEIHEININKEWESIINNIHNNMQNLYNKGREKLQQSIKNGDLNPTQKDIYDFQIKKHMIAIENLQRQRTTLERSVEGCLQMLTKHTTTGRLKIDE